MTFKTFLILVRFLAEYHCEDLATTGYMQGDVSQHVKMCKELMVDCMLDEGPGSFQFCKEHWKY